MEVLELLKNPLELKEDKLFLIQNELEKYPYFQALHLLEAKALKQGEPSLFEKTLEKTSLYCSRRKILFDYLHYTEKEDSQEKQEEELLIESNDFITQKEATPITENLDEIKEEHSFSEWLKVGSWQSKEGDKTKIEKYDKNHKLKTQDHKKVEEKIKIINEFLEKNPKISAPSKEGKVNIPLPNQSEEMSHLMTETLAKIYVEQKKYDKAITAYRILRLKYPEKSGFFADQINFIKELKNN